MGDGGSKTFTQSGFANLGFIEEQLERYEKNPASIDASWHHYFRSLERPSSERALSLVKGDEAPAADLRIYHLINAYRTYGHLMADLDPVAGPPQEEPWQLSLERLGFSSSDLSRPFPTFGFLPQKVAPLSEIVAVLREIYCGKIGVEYMGLQKPELEAWLQERIEPNRFKPSFTTEKKIAILRELNQAELLESFLHTKYTGQKRFSLEGGETLIPILKFLIEVGSSLGLEEFVLGMAHRGRLNVLSNILNKSHREIFSEFEEGYIPASFEGSGDVKYHKGFMSALSLSNGKKVQFVLSPNPSHLESVDPVVEGQVRAKQELQGDESSQAKVIALLIHGDAALAGQGVVYETLQLYRLPGYATGGTIHVVINNHIGFTSTPQETQSTHYCTDIARAFSSPVFHVNAEDPEGCVYAAELAMEIRQKFHCDVFIDLNCYRKYGHNESDEPSFTQPLEYQIIRKKIPIRQMYRDELIQRGVVEKQKAEALEVQYMQGLQQALQESKEELTKREKGIEEEIDPPEKSFPKELKSGVSKEVIKSVAERLSTVPTTLSIHPKLQHLLKDRLTMVQEGGKPLDWGMAELLAYGTLLWNGTHIRLTGQDCRRGTFSHRHAVWIDQKVEQAYSPLNHLKEGQGSFDVYNSLLSEYAALGFEFGYSCAYPEALVIWEAQFGDFSNGAQIIIDQYIATTAHKWGQHVGLVLFLPHGYEGQGPEHSSARIERFLELCGSDNMRVVNPTTPAQMFHLLRRQALDPVRKPLIVFTPKGLLRHPACVSRVEDLVEGSFQSIIDDALATTKAKRLVFCCGRFFYDIVAEKEKRKAEDLAVIRIEELYPLKYNELEKIIAKYKEAKTYIWAQEESQNMGAWEYMEPILRSLVPKNCEVNYIGRERSASPAVGSHALHKKQHEALMLQLF